MAEPICEDEGILQEWSPETQLLQQIPLKIQKGLFSQNLNLTCVDVVSEYIVLGTNYGLVYWYCRPNRELQRLRFENSNCAVTCVKVVSTVEYMVAAGTNQGTVTVFQIPKAIPDSIPDQLKPKQKQIERFTINGLHNASITNIEWSQNGMKLFSGDKNGVVVLTEIDFAMHLSKSVELLNEQFEIIQLSYNQQILLISTVYRSIICDGSNNWKVQQVGTKERKILGKFGATFCKFDHGTVLYASRPGHRLWLAEKNGTVHQTLIFKSAINSTCPKIQLINPVIKKEPYDTNFGKIIQFGDNKLITYNSEVFYVLHPGAVSVVSVLSNARKIIDLAVNENEVFVLEGERSLLRISPVPDKYSLDMLYQPISRRTSFNLDDFAAKIKDTAVGSLKKITKDLIKPEQTSPDSPPALADEALELPPIVNLPEGSMPAIYAEENFNVPYSVSNNHTAFTDPVVSPTFSKDKFNSLFEQDCHEEVISRPLRKRHNKKPKNLLNSQVLESESDTTSNASEDRLVWGVTNDMSLSDESEMSQSQSSFSVLRDISTLLNKNKTPKLEMSSDDVMKTSDTKSQVSLDTCESVSERLLMTPEKFREEQEKTFARLANQSLLDSFNSERTDNMSISINMTTSSSVSSKISENSHSPSDISENSSMVSRTKATESQSPDNLANESNFLPKNIISYGSNSHFLDDSTVSSQDEKAIGSIESSNSSKNSQKERLQAVWSNKEFNELSGCETETNQIDDCTENEESTNKESELFEKHIFSENNATFKDNKSEIGIIPEFGSNNIFEEKQNGRLAQMNCLKNFSETGQFFNPERHLNDTTDSLVHQKKENELINKAFSSVEPFSYGPPSGSSMLSSQPSSDFSSMPNTSQNSFPQIKDFSDHWPQYKTPEPITSFSACKSYVICTDMNDQVYYSDLSGLGLSWKLLDYKASMIRVSNDGSVVWLLNRKSAYALVNPTQKKPISDNMIEIAQNVKSFAIDSINFDGWVVTLDGRILRHANLLQSQVKGKEVSCDWIVTDIVCENGVVVALTENDTVICKPSTEDKFRPIKTLNPTTSLSLGLEALLWIVDEKNNIYFSDDFLNDRPQWWQVQISDYIFQNSSTTFQNIYSKIKLNNLKTNIHLKTCGVATTEDSVWIYNKFTSVVRVNKTDFTGKLIPLSDTNFPESQTLKPILLRYHWAKVPSVKQLPNIHWQALSAEGVFEDKGHIWLLSLDGTIFCTSPSSQKFQNIPTPCEDNVLCVAGSADTLWVLSESGRIYSRLGLTDANLSGNSWRELKLPQIDNLRFVWVSCGCDVAWGCDIHGRTFITIGSPHHMATNIFDAAWLEVEGRPKGVQFEKVFVGPQLYMVWAMDSKGNLYVREGIFSHYQIGTSWVFVGGIEAVHVTISGTSVWALASNGNIYRRCGISENNYIGDYWKSIPGSFRMITSSFTDGLWGITHENEIYRLNYNRKTLNGVNNSPKNKETHSSKEDISWEIVDLRQ